MRSTKEGARGQVATSTALGITQAGKIKGTLLSWTSKWGIAL
jgi:hypothetical protein